jgi:hypothetical protein
LPHWPHFDVRNRATMHFGDVCSAFQHTPLVDS